jgi:transposase
VAALLPHLAGVQLVRVAARASGIRVEAMTTGPPGPCSACGRVAVRVHSRYVRRLIDSSLGGRQVLVELTVRRFFCDGPACAKKTFVEQVPGLTVRHGRHTGPAAEVIAAVATALGGRAGARLVGRLAVPVSRMTLLRVVRRVPDPPVITPRVLGVDDFAQRRGHRYATILVDMHTHRPIDMLPDRDGDTLADWLRAHPGVQVVCRDRGGAYADGATRGAPQAIQVADRWHLMHNLSEAVQKVVTQHRRCLRPVPTASISTSSGSTPQAPTRPAVEGRRAANTRGRHAAVHALRTKGMGIKAITRHLQLDRKTVRKYFHAEDPEQLLGPNPSSRRGLLEPFKPYLQARCGEGVTATSVLFEEIRARGYRGGIRTLRRFLADVRGPEPKPAPVPAARRITAWIMRPDHKLSEDDRTAFKDALARCPDLATLTELAHGFNELVRHRRGDQLEAWINHAAAGPFPEVRSFATTLLKDFDAVRAGLTEPWNSGPVEGAINRVKTIKRQMYGRANLDLLRKRVLITT